MFYEVHFSLYFNPRPPRGGRPLGQVVQFPDFAISIHAPREGGDPQQFQQLQQQAKISIHAPREGGDNAIVGFLFNALTFQSTPPARGAT